MTVLPKSSSLWRHGDFMKLWAGQTISLVGSQITLLALPLTAVLTLNATAFQMGLLRAVQYAPAVLLGLFAGVWVDRMRRRPVLIAADLGRAALLGSIPLAALLGMLSMSYLYAVAFAAGALTVVFEVAYFAYLPALVNREHLVAANGRLQASEAVASIAGPGLGGLLVQVLTPPLAIAGDACSFLVSVLSLGLIRAREPASVPTQDRSVRREIAEGLGTVLRHPLLRATLLSSGITNFFAAIFNSLTILYATRQLGISPAGIGGIWVLGSVGGLAGAVVVGWVTARVGVGPTILLAELLIGAGSLAWPLVAGPANIAIPMLTLGLFVTATGDSFYNINAVSLRQAVVPHHLMGRVNASLRFVIWGAQPLGALLGGALGETIGLRGTLAVAAGGFLCAFACLLFTPIRRLREVPAPADSAAEAAGTGV